MKTSFLFLLLSLLCSTISASGATVYQCTMHPWIKSNKPGDKCTICGMDLVAVPAGDATSSADPDAVKLSPAATSVVGIRTSAVTRGPLVRSLRVAGVIDDDDTR